MVDLYCASSSTPPDAVTSISMTRPKWCMGIGNSRCSMPITTDAVFCRFTVAVCCGRARRPRDGRSSVICGGSFGASAGIGRPGSHCAVTVTIAARNHPAAAAQTRRAGHRNGFARSSCLRGGWCRRRIDPATCHHGRPRSTMTTRAVGVLSNQSDQPSAWSQSLIKPRCKRPSRNRWLPQINRQNQLLG
jgi:hypothetical protein